MQLFFRKALIKQAKKQKNDKQNEKEEREQTPSDNKTITQPSVSDNTELKEEVKEVDDMFKSLKVEDVEKGSTVNPTPTPNDATNDSAPNSYRGKVPWSDSQYHEYEDNDMNEPDGEEMEFDV